MKIKVTYDIDSCHKCPYSSNNAMRHNDPFTSGPSRTIWYCEKNDDMIIYDAWVIDPNCPFKKKKKK